MKRYLVTGASGFVGTALIEALVNDKALVNVLVRTEMKSLAKTKTGHDLNVDFSEIKPFLIYDFANISLTQNSPIISSALEGVESLIHLAARVHVMNDNAVDPLSDFRKINTTATLELARMAAIAGVKSFVFLSSIKVNGESTQPGQPFTSEDSFVPTEPYGLSKYEAEQGLLKIAAETGMEVVIIRPPLVYGPGVKANFESMLKWVNKGVPLPFGLVHNQRSLVALDNLVDFIMLCADQEKSPNAANQVFLVSDQDDVSTTVLLKRVAKSLGKSSRLLPIPVSFMRFAATILGRSAVAKRLFGSLQLDSSKATNLLGWKPVTTMQQQLEKTADAFLKASDTR